MRYLSSASNPLAHYWEEDFTGLWGAWVRLRARSQRAFNHLIGEIVFAHLYLLYEVIESSPLSMSLSRAYQDVAAHIRLSAGVKRAIDIMGAAFGLALTIPVWLIVPVLIKIDSRGPVIYSQVRVGRNRRRANRRRYHIANGERRISADRRSESGFGKPFEIFKFRTMHRDAEKLSGPVWATQDDPRITRVGKILRKIRLDEIPQLLNVLMGDMSLVGPRPERPYFVERLDRLVENYSSRFDVRPGVTGLAQVEHKYDESLDDVNNKVKYDLRYIKGWNILADIKIILKTVVVVLTARGM